MSGSGNDGSGGASAALGVQETFRDLVRMATRDGDPVDVFMLLSERAIDLLAVAACAVMVSDPGGGLHAVGTSGSSTGLLELLRALDEEGPGRECVATARSVVADARTDAERWPRLAAQLAREGLTVVHAFPLLSRSTGVGALSLIGDRPLDANAQDIAQAFADLAALALLRSDAEEDALAVARRLHRTVQARATLSQAVGMIAERFDLDPDGALRRIRATAAAHGLTLSDLADAIVRRDLPSIGVVDLATEEH